MSEPQDNGTPQPTKKPRAKKIPTGRPRGRPPKRDSFLVPSELRRTLLAILDEEIEIRTTAGVSKASRFEGVLRALVANATKGNPTSLNQLMRLMMPALEDRVKAHGQVRIGEYLRQESESPDPKRSTNYKDVRVQFGYAKNKY